MKTSTIAILAALGVGAYFLLKKSSSSPNPAGFETFSTIPAGYTTPAGNTVTQPITSAAQGVDYINKNILQPKTVETRVYRNQRNKPIATLTRTREQTSMGELTTVDFAGRTTHSLKTGKLRKPGYAV